MTTVFIIIIGIVFGIAALLLIWRIVLGPSVLDRIVAADALLAAVICGLAAEMAIHGHAHTLPVLLALALFAMVGSVSISRFMSRQEDSS